MMVRSTWWISTIITVVLLLVLGSTTIKADSPYTYTYYVTLANGTDQVWKSDQEITLGTATGSYYYDPNTGMYIERASATRNVYRCTLTANACILSWDGQEWVASLPVISCNANVDTMYHTVFCYNAIDSMNTTAPNGFPTYNDKTIEELITDIANDVIQSETSSLGDTIIDGFTEIKDTLVGDNASQHINTIPLYDIRENIISLITLYQTLDPEIKELIDSELYTLITDMQEVINGLIRDQNGLKPEISIQDIMVVNNIYDIISNFAGQVGESKREEDYWDDRDIESSVSESIKQSDQEEIDYLEDLIAETSKSISDLSPSENFTPQQIQTATEIVDGIWENEIIKKIIPLAACFMVVCVVLGVKYRL